MARRTPLSLETLGYLGEFVGGIVVILTIVYLARQVRQNTESLRTENYARALERVAAIQSRFSSDPSLAVIFEHGVIDPTKLSPQQRIQFTWAFYEMFGAFEFMYHQAESGALPNEVWERWSATLAWWISLPGVASWWRSKPTPFSSSFSSLVDSYCAANPIDTRAAERWAEFLAGTPDSPRPGQPTA